MCQSLRTDLTWVLAQSPMTSVGILWFSVTLWVSCQTDQINIHPLHSFTIWGKCRSLSLKILWADWINVYTKYTKYHSLVKSWIKRKSQMAWIWICDSKQSRFGICSLLLRVECIVRNQRIQVFINKGICWSRTTDRKGGCRTAASDILDRCCHIQNQFRKEQWGWIKHSLSSKESPKRRKNNRRNLSPEN
jgi:hypothetical protein